jgi:uroporphyrinogen-III decarboxylase
MTGLKIDHQEIERRKQLRRDLWDYRSVDHIPVVLWLLPEWQLYNYGYTYVDLFEHDEVHFEVSIERVKKSLRLIPDDYIPFARMVLGPMTLATMFGAGIHWSDDPDQPPGVAEPIITDLEQVYGLARPSVTDGIMPKHLRRLRYHSAHLPPDVYLTGVFAAGPLQVCADLIESNVFYLSFHDNPDALHHLLDVVTDVQQEVYRAVVDTVGGIDRLTSVDWDPVWAPEKYKSHVSDDICGNISPKAFREFSIPYNNRLYEPWGSGLMHNCGPQTPKWVYLEHNPRLKGINCAYDYSYGDLADLGEIFAGWGIVEVNFDSGETAEEMLEGFRFMMETLAPDTVGVPVCTIDESWADDEITAFYWEMRKIADEYAANMRWVGDPDD